MWSPWKQSNDLDGDDGASLLYHRHTQPFNFLGEDRTYGWTQNKRTLLIDSWTLIMPESAFWPDSQTCGTGKGSAFNNVWGDFSEQGRKSFVRVLFRSPRRTCVRELKNKPVDGMERRGRKHLTISGEKRQTLFTLSKLASKSVELCC